VLLSLDPDGSEIIGTDLEVGIRHRLIGVHADAPVKLLLAPTRLRAILSTSDDDEIAFRVDGDKVRISGRRSEFTLASEDSSLFPSVPTFDAAAYHEVAAADLRRMIRRCSPFVDVENTRYALGGCLIESEGQSMTMVGTDGRRLAKQVVSCTAVGDSTIAGLPVIPARALKLVDKVLEDDGPPVHVATTDKAVLFRTESATIYSRLVEGRFPYYRQVFPSETTIKAHFEDLADLQTAVEQAGITCSEESRGIDWRFSDGVLRLSSQSADVGSASIEVVTCFEGSALEITFDSRYALQALQAIGDNVPTALELIDSKNAAVFRTTDSYCHVLMPLARDR
jgi:DNA polymerase-3 subunit beta